MTIIWIISLTALAVVWGMTIADVLRRGSTGWNKAGWIALVVVLPFIGSFVYWLRRPPTREEADQQYLAEADVRHSRSTAPFDSTGLR